jgi:hypothetical protein
MGPGTRVYTKITHGVMPKNGTDRQAMAHDVNYMLANGDHDKMDLADNLAIDRASLFDADGLLMKAGLTARKEFHLKESDKNPDYEATGRELKYILLHDPRYQELEFGVDDFIA